MSIPEADISYICSGRLSIDSTFFAIYDNLAGSELITGRSPRSLSMMSVGARNFDPIGLASASNCADLDYSPHELSPSDKETSCLPLNNLYKLHVLFAHLGSMFTFAIPMVRKSHGRERQVPWSEALVGRVFHPLPLAHAERYQGGERSGDGAGL
ncbi:hypothetical protein RHGRI_009306 [Rhododendron griersonianum]|uniref:Uncharacterized protein n=1 Tax=Rhododendron griersonianum TaxID=479676 RepID=A0AAV6L645_9ERIC|nr:hypothetical protein RHGRI_009306 [Rhododendron griersonianum]